MNSSNNNHFKVFAACTAILLTSVILCIVGFGLGFATRHVGLNRTDRPAPIIRDIESDALPSRSPRTTGTDVASVETPENFDIFWETIERLDENFIGEVPSGNDLTYAAAEGMMEAGRACTPADGRVTTTADITPPQTPADAPDNFDFFWQTVNQVATDCGDSAPQGNEITYAAIDGVIVRLNDHNTELLTPDRAEQFRIELDSSFEGIGANVVEAEGGGVQIVRPFAGSPAERAGIRSNDIVIAVDGKDVTDLTLDEAVQLIRGPADSTVVLTIKRQGDASPFDVEVTRGRIDIPVLEAETRDDNLLYLALYDFSSRSSEEMKTALTDAVNKKVDGVILDLRGNPGGFLDAAIEIASLFIKDGVIATEEGERNFEHDATGDVIVPDLPLVVLVDGGSASASEIVAGAIQDLKRGILVGETTYGKGSVQSLFDMSDGSLLRVTTARWFTPLGREIDGEGLQPDIRVQFGDDPQSDPQLQAAVEYLLKLKAEQ